MSASSHPLARPHLPSRALNPELAVARHGPPSQPLGRGRRLLALSGRAPPPRSAPWPSSSQPALLLSSSPSSTTPRSTSTAPLSPSSLSPATDRLAPLLVSPRRHGLIHDQPERCLPWPPSRRQAPPPPGPRARLPQLPSSTSWPASTPSGSSTMRWPARAAARAGKHG